MYKYQLLSATHRCSKETKHWRLFFYNFIYSILVGRQNFGFHPSATQIKWLSRLPTIEDATCNCRAMHIETQITLFQILTLNLIANASVVEIVDNLVCCTEYSWLTQPLITNLETLRESILLFLSLITGVIESESLIVWHSVVPFFQ